MEEAFFLAVEVDAVFLEFVSLAIFSTLAVPFLEEVALLETFSHFPLGEKFLLRIASFYFF
ncbi:MAG: hypothetical protein ACLTEH_02000 [Clostridia bacterium]